MPFSSSPWMAALSQILGPDSDPWITSTGSVR